MYHLDKDDVYLMSKPIKIYLFKEADEVKVSFRITDYVNFHREMSIEHFQYICDNWRTGVEGLEMANTSGTIVTVVLALNVYLQSLYRLTWVVGVSVLV